jgi:DNA polymerase-3 subunit delta
MPAATNTKPVIIVCGEDDFGVKERALQLFQQWRQEVGEMDHETIDAAVSNSGEALRALAKLREGLQTLPFFGTGKVVWLKNCNFLGEERTAMAQAVTEALAALARELQRLDWQKVRLLISAGKVDRRRVFYKTLEKIGSVETLDGWSAEDNDWAEQAEGFARRALRQLQKEISDEALARLAANVGPNIGLLHSEIEKLALYAGSRARIEAADVEAVVTKNKQVRAFALGDALGERNLAAVLSRLDEELWESRRDPHHSEIGVLYGLISKVRSLIVAKEMMAQGWLKPEREFPRFQRQLSQIPADALPEDRKYKPAPYVLYRAAQQASNYARNELTEAMDLLLECNQRLISSGLEPSLILQQSLVRIVSRPAEAPSRRGS